MGSSSASLDPRTRQFPLLAGAVVSLALHAAALAGIGLARLAIDRAPALVDLVPGAEWASSGPGAPEPSPRPATRARVPSRPVARRAPALAAVAPAAIAPAVRRLILLRPIPHGELPRCASGNGLYVAYAPGPSGFGE